MNARNPLEEGLLYDGTNWVRGLDKAYKYETPERAIEDVKKLRSTDTTAFKYKIFVLQTNGPQINFGEVTF